MKLQTVHSGAGARLAIDGDTVAIQWRRKDGKWGPVKFYDGAPESVLRVARAVLTGEDDCPVCVPRNMGGTWCPHCDGTTTVPTTAHVGWNTDEPSLARAMREAGLTAREVSE